MVAPVQLRIVLKREPNIALPDWSKFLYYNKKKVLENYFPEREEASPETNTQLHPLVKWLEVLQRLTCLHRVCFPKQSKSIIISSSLMHNHLLLCYILVFVVFIAFNQLLILRTECRLFSLMREDVLYMEMKTLYRTDRQTVDLIGSYTYCEAPA